MDKKDIQILDKVMDTLAEMCFKDLKGSDLVDKVIVFQNFGQLIKKLKEPKKIEPVPEEKAIKEPKKKRKKKNAVK